MANDGGQLPSLLQTVVDPRQEHILVADTAAGPVGVRPGGGDHRRDRVLAVDRNHAAAEGIVGRVQRDGQVDGHALGAQALDEGHQPDGRDGDPSRAEVEGVGTRPAADRSDHRIVVVERFAHPHEDHVGHGPLLESQVAGDLQQLVDDLGFREVAVEPGLAGGAEAAPDRAADLGADADGGPGPPAGAGRIVHHHGLHRAPVLQPEEVLGGEPLVRLAAAADVEGAEPEGRSQAGPGGGRQRAHRLEGGHPTAPEPVPGLRRPVGRVAGREQRACHLIGLGGRKRSQGAVSCCDGFPSRARRNRGGSGSRPAAPPSR